MYDFVYGRTGYGIGVENMGFVKPQTDPIDSIYGPAYNVRGQLMSLKPGFLKIAHQFVPVDLRANGVYFSGDFALQALSDFNNGNQ